MDYTSELSQQYQRQFIKNWLSNSTLEDKYRAPDLNFGGEFNKGDTFNAIRYRNGDFYYG